MEVASPFDRFRLDGLGGSVDLRARDAAASGVGRHANRHRR
jgi:hypothetical protein